MQRKCVERNKRGEPCRNTPLKSTDPDGKIRCFRHSIDPAVIAKRAETDEKARQGGIEGKEADLAVRRELAKARGRGEGPPVQKKRGSRGLDPLPPGYKPTETLTIKPETRADPAPAETVESVSEALKDVDLTTGEGRSRFRHTLVRLKAQGAIDSRELETYLRVAADQAKDKAAGSKRRGSKLKLVPIATREEADEYREAQEIRGTIQ